jgi:endoglycosylceramidase
MRAHLVFTLFACGAMGCTSSGSGGAGTASHDAGRGGDGDRDAGMDDVLRPSPLHAEPDSINGGVIVDDSGRAVLLRGVNVNALAEYWKAGDFATTFPLIDSDVDQIASVGWNAVRLLLSWSRVEPIPGEYDAAYLSEVDDAIARFAQRGVYTIVDLHQDAWGATLAARPDEACPAGQKPAFGWDGAPAWATLDGVAVRCTAGLREFSPAVRAAWGAFWSDAAGPGGVGVRTRYARMLGALAGRYAKEPAVAGFDVMNEPNAFGPGEGQSLSNMYADALREIRAGEQDAGGLPHLVLFEPSALWSTTGNGPPPDFERDRDVVYAPHLYAGGFSNGPISRAAFDIAVTEAAGFGGAPILSGEWGTGPARAGPGGDGYFLAHQTLEDELRVSATLWTFRESCGDPHHAGDYRDGRTPGVWGEFELDCKTNTVTGTRRDLVAELTRAYVRAAPGALSKTHYDPDSGAFEASGTATDASALFVAFYPTSKHGAPRVTASGLDRVRTLIAPGGNAYLIGESRGGEWSVSVASSSP